MIENIRSYDRELVLDCEATRISQNIATTILVCNFAIAWRANIGNYMLSASPALLLIQ
jgi:hypothetical protein